MIKTIALLLVAAVVLLLALAATRPDTFSVQRSARIQAPADQVHALINDLHRFNRWNPYEKKDPNLKGSYSGPAAGPGATYAFEGNKNVGKGSLRIVDSQPGQVTMELHMIEPMEGRNTVRFTLVPQGGATEVTWAMQGASPFIGKLMGLVFDMDKMIGGDFEAGLAALKTLAEQKA
jgi:carbon monoxide dehydrogenase subunit G